MTGETDHPEEPVFRDGDALSARMVEGFAMFRCRKSRKLVLAVRWDPTIKVPGIESPCKNQIGGISVSCVVHRGGRQIINRGDWIVINQFGTTNEWMYPIAHLQFGKMFERPNNATPRDQAIRGDSCSNGSENSQVASTGIRTQD
jgi:hypothetical protein